MRFQGLTLPEIELLSHKAELEESLLMAAARIAGNDVRGV